MEKITMAIHSNPQHRIGQFHNNNNNNNNNNSINNNNNSLSGNAHFTSANLHSNEILENDNFNNNLNKNIINNNVQSTLSECAACRKPIKERFLLKALDQLWHEDCLKCACCDCRLGEVGSTLFTKANLILCKRDYLRLFGNTGVCSACNKTIPAFEMVMRAPGGRVYHLECFQCAHCNHRFCIGDRFHLHDNRILCEYDYEELGCSGINENSINNKNNPGLIDSCDETASGGGGSHSHLVEKLNDHHNHHHSQSTNSVAPVRPVQIRSREDGSSGYGSPDSVMSDSGK